MSDALARAMLALAAHCLGEDRRAWAAAMTAEADAARADGRALAFASGCLLAALRDMPARADGQLTLAAHALALLLALPGAAFVVSGVLLGMPWLHRANGAGTGIVNIGNVAALPTLAALMLAFAATQLRLAWLTAERDWARVPGTASLAAATVASLAAVGAITFLTVALASGLALLVVTQLLALAALAHWHGDIERSRHRRRA